MEQVTTDEVIRTLAITCVRLEKAASENARLAAELDAERRARHLAESELQNTRALAAALEDQLRGRPVPEPGP